MNLVRWLIWSWFLRHSFVNYYTLGLASWNTASSMWGNSVSLLKEQRHNRKCVCVCVHAHTHSVMSESLWPHDCSPLDSSVHRIFQAKILQWVDIPSSREHSRFRDWTHVSFASCIGRHILYHWAIWESHRRRGPIIPASPGAPSSLLILKMLLHGWAHS